MNGIVVYSTKYGITKQYAEWIAEELRFDVKPADDIDSKEVSKYSTVILGTPIYFGNLKISKWIKQNANVLKEKEIHIFVVNSVSKKEDILKQLEKFGLKITSDNFYTLKGQVDIEKLGWFDKFVTNMISKSQKIEKEEINKDDIDQIVGKINI